MARSPRPVAAPDYSTVHGLGLGLVRVEEQVSGLADKVDDHAARSERGHAALNQRVEELDRTVDRKFDQLDATIENLARDLIAKSSYQDGVKDGAGYVLKLGWKGICYIAGSLLGLIAAGIGGLAYYAPHLFTH